MLISSNLVVFSYYSYNIVSESIHQPNVHGVKQHNRSASGGMTSEIPCVDRRIEGE